jgi:serine/threonine-protein kinase
VSTIPKSGQDIRKGSTVQAVVSRGPERYDVPDLSGMTQAQAASALKQRSLAIGRVRHVWNPTVLPGLVVSSDPPVGTPLKRGTPVVVTLSRGPRPIPIPNFTHKDGADAKTALEQLGFHVNLTMAYDDHVPAGQVVSQTPPNGTGFRGDHLGLVVSKGPHLVQVPDVNHYGISAAEQKLTDAGFKYEVKENSPSFGLGFVVDQSPGANAMAPYGSVIILYVV